jgi:hypothetical protein
VADEERTRRDLDALDEAVLAMLLGVSATLDQNPRSPGLVHEWLALVRHLRIEAPGGLPGDPDELAAGFRARLASGREPDDESREF